MVHEQGPTMGSMGRRYGVRTMEMDTWKLSKCSTVAGHRNSHIKTPKNYETSADGGFIVIHKSTRGSPQTCGAEDAV